MFPCSLDHFTQMHIVLQMLCCWAYYLIPELCRNISDVTTHSSRSEGHKTNATSRMIDSERAAQRCATLIHKSPDYPGP